MENEKNQEMLRDLVTHFREKRDLLRQQWVQKVIPEGLFNGMTKEELEIEYARMYDAHVKSIETGEFDAVRSYTKKIAERGVLHELTTGQIIRSLVALRDICMRSMFERYCKEPKRFLEALDLYEPSYNENLSIAVLAFIEERERVVRQQEEAIRELSTPVLQISERFLILPIIGVLDTFRARQLTGQLLLKIRETRAKVVVMDITGVPNVDSKVANHIVQTVEASRLLGATVIVTGVSPEISQTIVTLGIDLSRLKTMGDLQGGIEEATRILNS